ncbi:erythromycin esterase family protein [Bacteroidota bacterium]
MKTLKGILSIIMVLLMIISCNNSETKNSKDPFMAWANTNASVIKTLELTENLKDLEQLKQIVGNARLVCLGESRHDIHEQFQLKHRFIKYLVEELDFTVFILEASLPYTSLINEYILTGEGNINEIMANMPGWFIWDTQEILNIISWMRNYNEKPENEKKIQFHGIDITAPVYGLNSIFDYLKKVDPAILNKFQEKSFGQDIIDDNYWPNTFEGYSALSSEKKEILKNNYNELFEQIKHNKTGYISNSTEKEYSWILRLAYSIKEANRMFSANNSMEKGLIRDSTMANNTMWIINSLLKNEKTIIWAHNVHITKSEFKMTGEVESIQGMGYILSQKLKNNMVSIGASFNQGNYNEWNRSFAPAQEKTIDGSIAKLNKKFLLLNLKGETDNEEVKNWLNTNNVILGQDFEMICIPIKSFDAIYYVDKISRTIPNQESLNRFRN